MVHKTAIAVCLFFCLGAGLGAQEIAPGGVLIDSNPAGATAELSGPLKLSGLTPATFPQRLDGRYELTIKKPGYEKYQATMYLQSDRAFSVSVNLKSKTRFKATMRSMLIPGWGQIYSEQKKKGAFFMVLTVGAAAAYFASDNEFRYRRDLYETSLAQFNAALTYEEKELLFPELKATRQRAYDAETERLITIGVGVGIWGLNFLDALLFFPDYGKNAVISDITIKPVESGDGAQLILTRNF